MRPTISIHEWKIAADLASAKAIQREVYVPPCPNCTCAWCRNWEAAWSFALSPEIATPLKRLGIKIEKPADIYAEEKVGNGANYRIKFYTSGVILSGPAVYIEHEKLGTVSHLSSFSKTQHEGALAITYAHSGKYFIGKSRSIRRSKAIKIEPLAKLTVH